MGPDFAITAAIPAYNAERFIGDAIESCLHQSYPCAEVLVVDDGSTDRTATIASSFRDVRCLSQPNRGTAAARNLAITEARGDVIAFLDADDLWLSVKLERQVECLRDCPDLGMVYTGLRVVDAALRPIEDLVAVRGERALRNTFLLEKPFMTGIGSTALVPVKVARAVRFDERLNPSADWAFACQVAMRWKVRGVPEPLALYRQHSLEQAHHDLEAVEHDVTLVWQEMFSSGLLPAELRRLRRRGQANLATSLGAGYMVRAAPRRGMGYLLRAFALRPDRVISSIFRYVRRRWSTREEPPR